MNVSFLQKSLLRARAVNLSGIQPFIVNQSTVLYFVNRCFGIVFLSCEIFEI